MPVSYISQNAAAATTLTMPTHAAGDLLLMFAYRTGSTAAPTVPAGWTTIAAASGGGGTSNSSALAWKLAASSSETSGTWTNATQLVCLVYRGVRASAPIGGDSVNTGTSGTSVAWTSLTMSVGDGSSWIAEFFGHRSNLSSTGTSTSGGEPRRAVTASATGTGAGYDTNGGTASFSGDSVSITGTSSNYIARAVEIVAQPDTRIFLVT